MNTDQSLILPLRNSSGCPWCAGGFQLFLQSRQIDFDQLPQLVESGFEVLRGGVVLSDLGLSRTRDGHSLRAHDVTDALVDRRRRVHVPLSRGVVTTQRTQDLVCSSIKRRRVFL